MPSQVKAVSPLPAPGVMTIAAGQFGLLGDAHAQSTKATRAMRPGSRRMCRSVAIASPGRSCRQARGVLGDEAFAQAWREGSGMELEEAVRYTLNGRVAHST